MPIVRETWCCILICRFMQNTTTQWRRRGNEDERHSSLKKYTSHFIWKVYVWEGVGDRTELQHIDPHSDGHQRCVFLVLQGCSTWGSGTHSARCGLSLPHLVTNGFSKLTDFLSSPSYIIVQSPTQSLEWHVWSSSSGNNCHAVHRSLSSDVSVYDCTTGFYLVPFCQPSPPTPMEYATSASLEWHVWPGRRSIYNTGFNHRWRRTKEFKNGTWYFLAQQYTVRIKGKVEQSRERSCALPITSV